MKLDQKDNLNISAYGWCPCQGACTGCTDTCMGPCKGGCLGCTGCYITDSAR